MPNSLILTIIPTGGIIKIDMQSEDLTGDWLLTRMAMGTPTVEAPYTLYSGPPLVLPNNAPMWLDYGDGLNQPLDPTVRYSYTFTTVSGSVTEAAQPVCAMEIAYDDYTRLLVRILQAGVKSLVPPSGVAFNKKPVVTVSMPLTGTPPIPCISINEDLLQQGDVPIGHGMNVDTQFNEYQIFELVMRRFRITIFTSTVEEREFWKFAVISLFKSVMIPVLESMGQNVTNRFQAASSQIVDAAPGFYFCDIGIEFTGDMPIRIKTNYGVFTISDEFSVIDQLPISGFDTGLANDGYALQIIDISNYPTSPFGLPPGAIYSNGYLACVVPGYTPSPVLIPPVFDSVTSQQLLAAGGLSLSTSNPGVGVKYLWNNNGVICIASIAGPDTTLANDNGVMRLLNPGSYPITPVGLLPGSLWYNYGSIGIVSGGTGTGSQVIIYGNINSIELLSIGGLNLPTSPPPAGSLQLWNNLGVLCIA